MVNETASQRLERLAAELVQTPKALLRHLYAEGGTAGIARNLGVGKTMVHLLLMRYGVKRIRVVRSDR